MWLVCKYRVAGVRSLSTEKESIINVPVACEPMLDKVVVPQGAIRILIASANSLVAIREAVRDCELAVFDKERHFRLKRKLEDGNRRHDRNQQQEKRKIQGIREIIPIDPPS